MSLLDRHEKKKKPLPQWIGNLRDLLLIISAFLGFAIVAVVYIPHLPQPLPAIAYIVGMLAVGVFIRSLAK